MFGRHPGRGKGEVTGVTVTDPGTEVVIAGEVVAAIGAHAAASVPGVLRLEGGVSEMLAGLGRTARHRIAGIDPAPVTGAAAVVAEGLARLRIGIAVAGDRPVLPTVAAVQRSVAAAVAGATGLAVAGVDVAVLDVVLHRRAAGWPADRRGDQPGAGNGQPPGAGTAREPGGEAGGGSAGVPGRQRPVPAPRAEAGQVPEARGEVAAAVLLAAGSVPGLRPASPVRVRRAAWMPFDPALLAVSLDQDRVEVQLAATRLPLPPLLARAAAAVRAATAGTPWQAVPARLVVRALDAAALRATVPPAGDVPSAAGQARRKRPPRREDREIWPLARDE
jgi:uncharacterized alkaline shock family protein YloU